MTDPNESLRQHYQAEDARLGYEGHLLVEEVRRLRRPLEILAAGRCSRLERDRALDERARVVAWLDLRAGETASIEGSNALDKVSAEIEEGSHLPSGKLPPEDPHAGRVCATAGVPAPMRCPRCRACDALEIDPEKGP